MAILIGTIFITLWIVWYPMFGLKHFCHSSSPAILPRSTFLANTRMMKECKRIRRIKYVLPHFHLFGKVAAMEWKTQVYERSSWSGAAELTRVWERRASDREPPHAMNWAQLLHYKKAHLLYGRTCSRTSIFGSSCTYMCTQIVTWMNKNTTHPLKNPEIVRFTSWNLLHGRVLRIHGQNGDRFQELFGVILAMGRQHRDEPRRNPALGFC